MPAVRGQSASSISAKIVFQHNAIKSIYRLPATHAEALKLVRAKFNIPMDKTIEFLVDSRAFSPECPIGPVEVSSDSWDLLFECKDLTVLNIHTGAVQSLASQIKPGIAAKPATAPRPTKPMPSASRAHEITGICISYSVRRWDKQFKVQGWTSIATLERATGTAFDISVQDFRLTNRGENLVEGISVKSL